MSPSAETDTLFINILSKNKPTAFEYVPNRAQRAEICATFSLLDVKKLTLTGTIEARKQNRWYLSAKLGAHIQQPCAVTLKPVVTVVNENVIRNYIPKLPANSKESEIEMPDETLESLPHSISLADLLYESLALCIPLYPRRQNATFNQSAYQTNDDAEYGASPFAALAHLKQK